MRKAWQCAFGLERCERRRTLCCCGQAVSVMPDQPLLWPDADQHVERLLSDFFYFRFGSRVRIHKNGKLPFCINTWPMAGVGSKPDACVEPCQRQLWPKSCPRPLLTLARGWPMTLFVDISAISKSCFTSCKYAIDLYLQERGQLRLLVALEKMLNKYKLL